MIIIDDNNYIENIKKDRWKYLDQKYLKGSVGLIRWKIQHIDNIVSNKKKSSLENNDWLFRM